MSESMRDPRQSRIDANWALAEALLNTAQTVPMKQEVQLAVRDLDSAAVHLERQHAGEKPYVHSYVDVALLLAETRLNWISYALKAYGPAAGVR